VLFLAACGLVDAEFAKPRLAGRDFGLGSCVLRGSGKIVSLIFLFYGVLPAARWGLKRSSRLFVLVVWGFLFEFNCFEF